MTPEPPEDGSLLTLSFKSHPKRPSRDVRACLAEGSLWFDAMDICDILGLRPEYVIPAFDRTALDSDIAQFDLDGECIPVVSPIGAWKIANSHDTPTSDVVSRWTKSEASRLAPDHPKDDARRVVTLNADGTLPPRPGKYSGRLAEWRQVRDSDAYLQAKGAARAEAIRQSFNMANPGADYRPRITAIPNQ